MKPMLACDFDESKLKFPVIAQPKIDGVRALNIGGTLVGRRLKPLKNIYTTELYSHPAFTGFDGELAAEVETHPDLCRLTSSATGTIKNFPFTLWWLFDYVTEETQTLPYIHRYGMLISRITTLQEGRIENLGEAIGCLRYVPMVICKSLSEVQAIEELWLSQGYEGVILRDPNGMHKQGRSTVREGGLLRIKRFQDSEATVIRFEEGQTNNNEAQINELGKTFRSSHAENMAPNGQVGTIIAQDIKTGNEIKVSPGELSIDERIRLLWSANEYTGKTFTYKSFPKGVKDKPRFPTFRFWRDESDIGKE